MKNRAVFGRDYLAAAGGAAAAAPVTVTLPARSAIKSIARRSRGAAGNLLSCTTAEHVREMRPRSIITTGIFAECKTDLLIISCSAMEFPRATPRSRWELEAPDNT